MKELVRLRAGLIRFYSGSGEAWHIPVASGGRRAAWAARQMRGRIGGAEYPLHTKPRPEAGVSEALHHADEEQDAARHSSSHRVPKPHAAPREQRAALDRDCAAVDVGAGKVVGHLTGHKADAPGSAGGRRAVRRLVAGGRRPKSVTRGRPRARAAAQVDVPRAAARHTPWSADRPTCVWKPGPPGVACGARRSQSRRSGRHVKRQKHNRHAGQEVGDSAQQQHPALRRVVVDVALGVGEDVEAGPRQGDGQAKERQPDEALAHPEGRSQKCSGGVRPAAAAPTGQPGCRPRERARKRKLPIREAKVRRSLGNPLQQPLKPTLGRRTTWKPLSAVALSRSGAPGRSVVWEGCRGLL
eukprot:scaffold19514_cov103-Isochrysis_galbana.AAC.2